MANVNGVQCIQSCLFGWVVLDISVESSTECISFVLDNRCDLICVRSQSRLNYLHVNLGSLNIFLC